MADAYLRVTVDDDSFFLSQHLPYVVRDARHAVVARGSSGTGVDTLPEGLYSVELISPRGTQHTELVHLRSGETTAVVVTEEGPALPPPYAPGDVLLERSPWEEVPPTRGSSPPSAAPSAAPPVEQPAADAEPALATLVDTAGCSVLGVDRDGWILVPEVPLAAVPVARFDLQGARWEVSLPLNPEGSESVLRQCRVRIDTSAMVPRLETSFGDKRRVCRMLVGMLRDNAVARGAELLDVAAELLLSKYSDPAAAALGGLTLHRFGRLQERQAWVENLARDFGWLPDGQILCAALLQRDRDTREQARGLRLLLDATAARPLYTDGLSLASELLRRWPGEQDAELRGERLARLAEFSAGADWDAVALTTRAT